MPDYPLPPHVRPDQLPEFTLVITDPMWLTRYFETVDVKSKQGVRTYTAIFTRVYEVLEPGPHVVRTLETPCARAGVTLVRFDHPP